MFQRAKSFTARQVWRDFTSDNNVVFGFEFAVATRALKDESRRFEWWTTHHRIQVLPDGFAFGRNLDIEAASAKKVDGKLPLAIGWRKELNQFRSEK